MKDEIQLPEVDVLRTLNGMLQQQVGNHLQDLAKLQVYVNQLLVRIAELENSSDKRNNE